MPVQTYCSRSDIEAVIGEASVLACIDDDQDGQESSTEKLIVTSVIERAALELNAALRHQYILSDVADNDWLKWANAQLAAYMLRTRRNNPAEQSHLDTVTEIRRMMVEIRWGRDQLPDQSPSFSHIPTVSTFRPELNNPNGPIAVDVQQSTGEAPGGNRKRNVAKQR